MSIICLVETKNNYWKPLPPLYKTLIFMRCSFINGNAKLKTAILFDRICYIFNRLSQHCFSCDLTVIRLQTVSFDVFTPKTKHQDLPLTL